MTAGSTPSTPSDASRPSAPQTLEAVLVGRYRVAMLWLTVGILVGAALELLMLRHWKGVTQKIPWVLLVALAIGLIALVRRRGPATVRAARILAVTSVLGSAFGVIAHVVSNWETAPLNVKFADTWDTMSAAQQWWLAATGGVGPAPSLAPGFVALSGIALALATLGDVTGRERA